MQRQRSDGGGGTFHFVLAVLVYSTSRATIRENLGLRNADCGFEEFIDRRAATVHGVAVKIALRIEWVKRADSSKSAIRNPQFEITSWPAHRHLTLKRYY